MTSWIWQLAQISLFWVHKKLWMRQAHLHQSETLRPSTHTCSEADVSRSREISLRVLVLKHWHQQLVWQSQKFVYFLKHPARSSELSESSFIMVVYEQLFTDNERSRREGNIFRCVCPFVNWRGGVGSSCPGSVGERRGITQWATLTQPPQPCPHPFPDKVRERRVVGIAS